MIKLLERKAGEKAEDKAWERQDEIVGDDTRVGKGPRWLEVSRTQMQQVGKKLEEVFKETTENNETMEEALEVK